MPDQDGNPTGLTSADFWYLGGAPSIDGYYTQYRLAMNPNVTPGQGTYTYSWITNNGTKVDLAPENPPTQVIITSKDASSPGFPSGEITAKASLNGFMSLAFQVRVNTPHRLELFSGAPLILPCAQANGIATQTGWSANFFYSIFDINGNGLVPITTHETLENRRAVLNTTNWFVPVDRATWTPGPNNGARPNVWEQQQNSNWTFQDVYQACQSPTTSLFPEPLNPTNETDLVVTFTQKYWVGTSTPPNANAFTGKCVQRNKIDANLGSGAASSVVSPAIASQCAAGVFVN